jgi:hypothetical protein
VDPAVSPSLPPQMPSASAVLTAPPVLEAYDKAINLINLKK